LLHPSILATDLARLGEKVRTVDPADGDLIHVDVVDGSSGQTSKARSCLTKTR
jgi:pentose-5-phosphate-3-epimerase